MNKKTLHTAKESSPHPRKCQIRVVISRDEMTADRQASIERSIDAVLAELVHRLDQRVDQQVDRERGKPNGNA